MHEQQPNQPQWITNAELTSIQEWTDHLHAEAKRLFLQDGTHGNVLFLFTKEKGIVSVNLVPPNIDHEQLNAAIINAMHEHYLYGVVLIGETWSYFIKEKDHTAFQLLDGEMRVADLRDEDKREALMVRMENRDGGCLIYLDEIIRDKDGVSLKECKIAKEDKQKWFMLNRLLG